MAWYDVPLATDPRNLTQPTIRSNFSTLQTDYSANHYALGAGTANDGKHKYIELPEYGGALPAAAANNALFYALEGTHSGITELSFRREDGTVIEFTEKGTYLTDNYTYLPSGLLVKFGVIVWNPGDPNPGTHVYSVDATIPAFSGVYGTFLQLYTIAPAPGALDAIITLNAYTALQFTYSLRKASQSVATDPANTLRIEFLTIGIPA